MEKREFRLTGDHLKLLRRANIRWEDCEYGAPAIDCKRPYGNSQVEADIVDILGWQWKGGEIPDELRDRARRLHGETETALQIVVLSAGREAVKPGLYRQAKEYEYRSWELVGD